MFVCIECGKEYADDPAGSCAECTGSTVAVRSSGELLVGRLLGDKYLLLRQLGAGGMGSVYRAKHRGLDSFVAIKVLRLVVADRKVALDRFYAEAKNTSKLRHPHNIRVFDFGHTSDGLVFLVMELLDGDSLGRIQKPIPVERALTITSQVCRALGEAHKIGLIHRDLKPDNVMITNVDERDFARVVDYGIAKLENATSGLTVQGGIIGTPEYLSPEQATGDAIDRRSDIYAVGLLLYEMLAGRTPFHADNPLTVAYKHKFEQPLPPSTYAPVDPQIEALILTCLKKRPDERFQTIEKLNRSIERFLKELKAETPQPTEDEGPIVVEVTEAYFGDDERLLGDPRFDETTVPRGHQTVPSIARPSRRLALIGLAVLSVVAIVLILINPFAGNEDIPTSSIVPVEALTQVETAVGDELTTDGASSSQQPSAETAATSEGETESTDELHQASDAIELITTNAEQTETETQQVELDGQDHNENTVSSIENDTLTEVESQTPEGTGEQEETEQPLVDGGNQLPPSDHPPAVSSSEEIVEEEDEDEEEEIVEEEDEDEEHEQEEIAEDDDETNDPRNEAEAITGGLLNISP